MNTQQSTLPDEVRSDLRSVVKAVDGEISRLSKAGTGESFGSTDRLRDNWNELVNLLDLGPEPEYRECPFCHALGMRLATRCGYGGYFRPLFHQLKHREMSLNELSDFQ